MRYSKSQNNSLVPNRDVDKDRKYLKRQRAEISHFVENWYTLIIKSTAIGYILLLHAIMKVKGLGHCFRLSNCTTEGGICARDIHLTLMIKYIS